MPSRPALERSYCNIFFFCFYIFITQLHVYVSKYVQHKLSRLGYIKYIQSGQHTSIHSGIVYITYNMSRIWPLFRSLSSVHPPSVMHNTHIHYDFVLSAFKNLNLNRKLFCNGHLSHIPTIYIFNSLRLMQAKRIWGLRMEEWGMKGWILSYYKKEEKT